MVTNLCPAQGNERWCAKPKNEFGYGAHFDINAKDKVLSGWGEFDSCSPPPTFIMVSRWRGGFVRWDSRG